MIPTKNALSTTLTQLLIPHQVNNPDDNGYRATAPLGRLNADPSIRMRQVVITDLPEPEAVTERRTSPRWSDGRLFNTPIQRLAVKAEQRQEHLSDLRLWTQEIQDSLRLPVAGGSQQEADSSQSGLHAEDVQLLEPAQTRMEMLPGGQRITYGTDRLRAGAGACELVCSQEVMYALGCLLLIHSRRCQQRLRRMTEEGSPVRLVRDAPASASPNIPAIQSPPPQESAAWT